MARSPKQTPPSTVAKKVPRPIVAPGPNPRGPPGWAEAQQERIADQNEAVSQGLPAVAGLAMAEQSSTNNNNNIHMTANTQDPATMQEQARAGLLPHQHHQHHLNPFHHNGAAGAGPTGQHHNNSISASSSGLSQNDAQRPSQAAPQHPLATSTTASGQDTGDTSLASTNTTGDGSMASTNADDSTASSPKSNKSKRNSPGRLSRTFHKLGEKLAIVPSRNSENLQNASTMPELP